MPLGVWVKSRSSGTPVGLLALVARRLRNTNVKDVVSAYTTAAKAGLVITVEELEAQYLTGYDTLSVVQSELHPKMVRTPEITAICEEGMGIKLVIGAHLLADLETFVGIPSEERPLATAAVGWYNNVRKVSGRGL